MVCHFGATLNLVELIILAAFLATSIICAFAVFEEYKEGKTYFNTVEKPVTPDDGNDVKLRQTKLGTSN